MKPVFTVTNQTTILSMVKFTFFATKQSLESHVNKQGHVGDLFFTMRALFIRNFFVLTK